MAAAETARLIASLELQDRNFTRGLSRVEKGVGRVDKRLGAFSGFLNRNMARALDSFAARGVEALGGAVQAGSDLNEEITKSEAVFGAASKEIIAFSETTATALGLSQTEALAAAGNFGNMFKTIGLAEGASEDMSERLVTLAADMASFNNEDPTEMLDRIRSGLAGEAEPLRRFGVLISAARVQEEAYASGIAKRGEALTEQQKVQARYNLILKDTAVQQGDVAKTGGNLAGQQRKLNAMLKDVSATVGVALLPAVTELTSEFVKLFQDPNTKAGIQAFAKDLGQGAKALVASLKQVDWRAFAGALGSAAGFAKDLVTAFLGLPAWLQTAVITGWGLNKISGGFLTSLASGLVKGVLGINAGVVNVNGPVAGAGGAGAAAGGASRLGRVANAVKVLGAVTIAGASIVALAEAFGQFQTTVTESQQNLQEKVNRTSTQNFKETIANLRATNKNLQGLGALDEALASIFGGGEITKNFEMAADRIVAAQGLTRSQTIGALDALKESQQQARELLLKTPKLDAAILKLEARLAGRPAPGSSGGRGGAPGAFRPTPEMREQVAKTQAVANAVKNAQSIASRENAALKTETANAKNAITAFKTTMSAENSAQKAEIARAKNAAATAGRNTTNAANRIPPAVRGNAVTVAASMAAAASRIVGAVSALDLSVNVTTVNRTSTINNRYGPSGGSATTNRSGELE